MGPDTEPHASGTSPHINIESPLSVGQFGGKWCSYNAPPDMPYDQREEDGGAMVFDSAPLAERLELLGQPLLELNIAADQQVAMVAVRLSDVAPDDAATRVSYGLLNLNHYAGSDNPQLLTPGEKHRVTVPLNGLAQSFPSRNRIRLSISTSYWPVVWPPPHPVRLTVDPNDSALILPVRPQTDDPDLIPTFGEPEGSAPIETFQVHPGEQDWRISRNLVDLTGKLECIKE